ncbi:hypothetical protein COCNU_04G010380 [Cocos nucifera]|uniref:Uncharacterized protein n=1 Tax=Cocos nucifera TaxID=13894 RepID=A0A8K0I736_COCNU|nr:hypothetical protein COCNU_04G010380 [Cocos nucifera]
MSYPFYEKTFVAMAPTRILESQKEADNHPTLHSNTSSLAMCRGLRRPSTDLKVGSLSTSRENLGMLSHYEENMGQPYIP